jgi:hypothetical protein
VISSYRTPEKVETRRTSLSGNFITFYTMAGQKSRCNKKKSPGEPGIFYDLNVICTVLEALL